MKKIMIALMLLGTLTVAACNTMEGLGEDVQKGGENLEEAANDSK